MFCSVCFANNVQKEALEKIIEIASKALEDSNDQQPPDEDPVPQKQIIEPFTIEVSNQVIENLKVIGHSDRKPLITLKGNINYLALQNIEFVGVLDDRLVDKSSGYGIYFGPGNYSRIIIRNCDFHDLAGFISFDPDAVINGPIVISNCEMDACHSSGIKINKGINNSWIIIVDCHIYGQRTRYFENKDPTHASGVSIRRNNIQIKNCRIHDGWTTRPIRTYQNVFPETGYQNIIIKNNLVYDTHYYVELIDAGGNIEVSNNTFVSYERGDSDPRWYFNYAMQISKADQLDLDSIEIKDNIFVGRFDPKTCRSKCSNNITFYCVEDLPTSNIIKYPDYEYFTETGKLFGTEIDYSKSHGKHLCNDFKVVDPTVSQGYQN
jgi:hypothetical protein